MESSALDLLEEERRESSDLLEEERREGSYITNPSYTQINPFTWNII